MAPGTFAVCPTSTATRKAARSQAERAGFFAEPAAASADAQFQAPKPSSNARARSGPRPVFRCKLMECALTPHGEPTKSNDPFQETVNTTWAAREPSLR